MKRYPIAWFAALLILQGCAELPSKDAADSAGTPCSAELHNFELAAKQSGISLSEPRAVPGFPALASNRFLASFDPAKLSEKQREDWLQRLMAAGFERRKLLAGMLDTNAAGPVPDAAARLSALDACARQQAAALPRSLNDWQRLAEALSIPDDYLVSRRIVGLYPLVSLGVRGGVKELQEDMRHTFALPAEDLAQRGELLRFVPEKAQEGTGSLAGPARISRRDSLGLRVPETPELEALLQRHAPIWEIDVVSDFDRPGRPYFAAAASPRVDTSAPVVYRYASLTRFAGAIRLQLNYLIWFDARPAKTAFDSLAGALDGLHWRVTLDGAGDALVYDSVHACGCYQMFFPTQSLAQTETSRELAEPPFIAQRLQSPSEDDRPVLRVSSAEHYLQRVGFVNSSSEARAGGSAARPVDKTLSYHTLPYEALYSVAAPKGVTSLFDREGIVPGTQRGERFYLWPMGVRSPGAMRERGRHATAFLGRRHLDDAHLLDTIFRIKEP